MSQEEKDATHVVLSTCPLDRARDIARNLVEKRLAACVNISDKVTSVYRWKGEICEDTESLLVIKTSGARLAELTRQLKSSHPYEVPEIVAMQIVDGNRDYIQWVIDETGER